MELCAGLRAYVRSMEQHAADDESEAHNQEQLDQLRVHFGRLIWRLEEAALPAGSRIVHSEDAVPPGTDDTWQ